MTFKTSSRNIFIIALFSLILLLPALDQIFHFSPVKELFEKRLPSVRPELPTDFRSLKNYPQSFEKFFNDNYGLRKSMIVAHSAIMDKVFDESPDARAVIGKEDWLYFDNHDSLLDAVGQAKLEDQLIVKGVEVLINNWQQLQKKNIKYLLVIARDKSTIYPEFLPDYMKPSYDHRVDKFLAALQKQSPNFPVIDLRPILENAKTKEVIYHKTDTHWNRRGAHYAYEEMMKKLGIKPHSRIDFISKENDMMRGDISDIMGLDNQNVNYDLQPKFTLMSGEAEVTEAEKKRFHLPLLYRNTNQNLPKLFVYNDSFFGDLFQFVNEHFSQTFSVNESPCNLDQSIIESYKPDVVIHEFWEGRIGNVLKLCN